MKGYTHIYTGNGKGKTTASFGLAVRALGNGLKVYIGQFMKGQKYGELNTFEKLDVPVERFGTENCIISPAHVTSEDRIKAKAGYNRAKEILISEKYDIVILDEICICPFFTLLTDEEIIDLIRIKPEKTELILTGRYASQKLIDSADLVTEMKEIKHYYNTEGVLARDGIER